LDAPKPAVPNPALPKPALPNPALPNPSVMGTSAGASRSGRRPASIQPWPDPGWWVFFAAGVRQMAAVPLVGV